MLLQCNKRGYAALIVVIFIQQFQIFKTRASIGSWGSVSSSPVRQLGLTDRPKDRPTYQPKDGHEVFFQGCYIIFNYSFELIVLFMYPS